MDILNAPNRELCTVRRDRTNTPLQALVTLNDVQFIEAARFLAQTTMKEGGATDDSKIDFIARRLLARPFRDNELKDTFLQADGTVNKDYASKGLDIDDNVYDSSGKVFKWNGHSYSLADAQNTLGFEKLGRTGSILFSRAA